MAYGLGLKPIKSAMLLLASRFCSRRVSFRNARWLSRRFWSRSHFTTTCLFVARYVAKYTFPNVPEPISSTIVVSCQSNFDISKHVSFWPFNVNFGILKAIIELWTCDQQVTAKSYTALKQLFIYFMT